MRFAFVIHSLQTGGMERVMCTLLHHFVHAGQEVHLVLIGRKRDIVQTLPSEVVIHKPAWSFSNRRRALHSLKTMAFLRSTMSRLAPDRILSFGEYWNNLVLLSLLGTSQAVFISDRSSPVKKLSFLQGLLRNQLYPKATGYIAQTPEAADVARGKSWNHNIQVIPNPVPTIPPSDLSSKVILTVGRLIKTKNVDLIISLFAQCRPDIRQSWRLVIVGGDVPYTPLSESLKAQANAVGLDDQISLEGEQLDVYPYYKTSSIFAFASSSEGFPNALAEAMSAGLAVIAFDCVAGPAHLIDDGVNGFLIPEGNETLYRNRLQLLMADETLRQRFSLAARSKMNRFAASKVAAQYLEFLSF